VREPSSRPFVPGLALTLAITIAATGKTAQDVQAAAEGRGMNVRVIDDKHVGLSFGETITKDDVADLLSAFGVTADLDAVATAASSPLTAPLLRTTPYLTHPVFNSHQSETQMLRCGMSMHSVGGGS
jgi:glycine dehydrogenase